jgi:hypothetical protein
MRAIVVCLWALVTAAASPEQDQKAPIPGSDELKKAEKAVKELFRKDFSAPDRAAKRSLSKKLLQESAGAKDAPEKYILLNEAIQAGIEAVDLWSSFRALDALGQTYQVDLDELRVATVNKAKKLATSPDDASLVAEAALTLWETYAGSELYDRAVFWAKEAETISKGAKDPGLIQAAKEMAAEAVEAKKSKEKADAALAAKAADPMANHEVGIYYAVFRADFARGLPYLAKGPPGPIRDAAAKDDPAPTDPEQQADLALAWQILAITEKNPSLKRAFADRFRYWRDNALKGATGLTKTKVVKKLVPAVMIVKASFAGPKGDVAKALQDIVDKNPSTPIKYDEYLAADLAGPGGKALTIEYAVESTKQRGTVTLQPGEVTFLPPVSAKDSTGLPAQFRYALLSGYCGAGARFTDVTPGARTILLDPYSSFGWNLGSIDPNPGQHKTTVVIAELHGRRFVRSVRQDDIAPMLIR